MSKWGDCDFKDFKKLQGKLDRMQKKETQEFFNACAKELAARLLALTIEGTPVGDSLKEDITDENGNKIVYKKGKKKGQTKQRTVKTGGTLRRGWTAKTEKEAESGGKPNVMEYINGATVAKEGDSYVIEIVNPVHYASYVEYGHRQQPGRYVPALGKRLKKAWVPGKFMLTNAEMNVEKQMPGVLERKITKFLEGLSDGK